MTDVHDKQTRSYNMSQIKGKNTRPEIMVRKFLHNNGFRYGLYSKYLPGKPDIVLKKHKTIIDIRSCFWHAHKNCKYGDRIKTDSVVVTDRIKTAIERDKVNIKKWKTLGWKVIIMWDPCDLQSKRIKSQKREKILLKLIQTLKGDKNN
jgi:DNA mismatch endonuclease, patch repair protein